MPDSALPPHLRRRHDDWVWPFSLIQRGCTAFSWGEPKRVAGTQADLKPIGEPGTWQLSRFPKGPWYAWYLAWSGKRGKDGKFWHFRIGARWDNVDNYVEFPSIALRRYTGGDDQDTAS